MPHLDRPVAINRRIAQHCSHVECGIDETIMANHQRVIHFHNRPDQYEQHQMLRHRDINTLAMLHPESASHMDFSLLVPSGTVPLHDQLKSIARNVEEYAEIFLMLGHYINNIYHKCGVLPEAFCDRGILESVMLVPTKDDANGLTVVLAPPYCLARELPRPIYAEIESELVNSGFYTDPQVATLMEAYSWGAQENEQ